MRIFFIFAVMTLVASAFPLVSQNRQGSICDQHEGLVKIVRPTQIPGVPDESCVTTSIAERFSSVGWHIITSDGDAVFDAAPKTIEEVAPTTETAEEVAEEVVEEVAEEIEDAKNVEEVAEEVVTEEAITEEEVADVEETEVTEKPVVSSASVQENFEWEVAGKNTFRICSSCHQENGEGVPSFYPSLANHLPNVEAKEGGRKYIINVVLYGLTGEITVLGQTYNRSMASWNSVLSDKEVAAVLNHELHSWGNADMLRDNFMPITPSEVAAERAEPKTSDEVYALRSQLGLTAEE